MTNAPVADQRRLLELQALDTRLDQLAHRRRTLPAHERVAELTRRAEELETELVKARTERSDLHREVAKAEADVEQVRARAARNQARLDAGQGSAKDMQALVSELEALARRQGELEDVELEFMGHLENVERSLAELEERASTIASEQAEATAQRDAELAEIDLEASKVRAARDAEAAQIDDGLLALYERLREQHGGVGAALLRGTRCEGCRLDLNASDVSVIRSAAPEKIVRCEECGRILVREHGA